MGSGAEEGGRKSALGEEKAFFAKRGLRVESAVGGRGGNGAGLEAG